MGRTAFPPFGTGQAYLPQLGLDALPGPFDRLPAPAVQHPEHAQPLGLAQPAGSRVVLGHEAILRYLPGAGPGRPRPTWTQRALPGLAGLRRTAFSHQRRSRRRRGDVAGRRIV